MNPTTKLHTANQKLRFQTVSLRSLNIFSIKTPARLEDVEEIRTATKPTVKQIAEELGEDEEAVIEAMESKAPVSLDAPVQGGDVPLYEVLADRSSSYEKFEDIDALRTEIAKLDPTEQKVISLRFIQGKSQAEAGKILGVSQMFVSRAERKIIAKLKDALTK